MTKPLKTDIDRTRPIILRQQLPGNHGLLTHDVDAINFRVMLNTILAEAESFKDKINNLHIEIEQSVDFISKSKLVIPLLTNLIAHGIRRCDILKSENIMDLKVEVNDELVYIDWVDNGTGFSKAELNDFIEQHPSFESLKSSLCMVNHLVKQLYGHITINSYPEIGTHIKVRIPNK